MAKKKKGGRTTTPAPKYQLKLLGHGALKRPTTMVDVVTDADRRAAKAMTVVMYREGGLAISAPQVDYRRSLFVWDDNDTPRTIVNPVIVEQSELVSSFHEGCLSIPGVFLTIPRAVAVHVTGIDLDENELDLELTGLDARVFQHEIDHLHGKTMVDRATEIQRSKVVEAWRFGQQIGVPVLVYPDGQMKMGPDVLADP